MHEVTAVQQWTELMTCTAQSLNSVSHVTDTGLTCLQEKERGDDDIVEVSMDKNFVVVNETKVKVDLTKYMERHVFNFDEALDEFVTNDQVSGTAGAAT